MSVLLLLGCVCGEPVVERASLIEAPPNDSHGSGHDADGSDVVSCEAMTSKSMAAPLGFTVVTRVIAGSTRAVVVAPGPDQVPTARSRPPLVLLHASLRI